MMTKHTKIVSGIALVFFLGSLVLFWGDLYMIVTSEARLQEERKEDVQKQNDEREFKSLIELADRTRAEREEMSSLILADEDVISFLTLIENIGSEQGVGLKTASLNVSAIDTLLEELSINVTIDGSYNSVMHTLKLFENLPYQSRISKMTVSQASADGGTGGWSITFTVHVTKFKKHDI